jgi:GR25 family glycosyltransferase involved in LPS biosynthesis
MIDKTYVLSLSRRKDRLDKFFSRLPKPWIFPNIEVFDAIDGLKENPPEWWKVGKGAWGCYRSHHSIIKKCIEEKINSVLILEDDAIFGDDFNDRSKELFENLPTDWEMCYLGGQHLAKPHDIVINNTVGVGTNVNRTHAYAINKTGFTKLDYYLSQHPWPKKKFHIDHMYGYLQSKDIIKPYCPLSMFVGQDGGKSDIVNFNFPVRWWNHHRNTQT